MLVEPISLLKPANLFRLLPETSWRYFLKYVYGPQLSVWQEHSVLLEQTAADSLEVGLMKRVESPARNHENSVRFVRVSRAPVRLVLSSSVRFISSLFMVMLTVLLLFSNKETCSDCETAHVRKIGLDNQILVKDLNKKLQTYCHLSERKSWYASKVVCLDTHVSSRIL